MRAAADSDDDDGSETLWLLEELRWRSPLKTMRGDSRRNVVVSAQPIAHDDKLIDEWLACSPF